MSTSSYSTRKPLRFKVGPSRSLLGYLLILFVCAGVCLILLPLGILIRFLACFCLLLLGWFVYKKYYLLRNKHSIKEIIFKENICKIIQAEGSVLEGVLGDGQYVSTFLVVLHLCIEGRNRDLWLPLFADAVDIDEFRRLRVKLRFSDRC